MTFSLASRHATSSACLDGSTVTCCLAEYQARLTRPQLTEMTDGNGQLLLTCLLDYRISLFEGSLPNAFFSSAFSKAHCPQKRSSSAILASADGASDVAGGRKASSPR